MLNEIEIIVYVKNFEPLKEKLLKYNKIVLIENYQELKTKLSSHDYVTPRAVIVDSEFLFDDNNAFYPYIKDDLMYKAASLIAYGKDLSINQKTQLYTLDFKGVVDTSLDNNTEIIRHVIKRSNLYSSTFENNYMRALIECNNLSKDIKDLTYLFDYLVSYYNISNKEAFDIRLVFVSLVAAFKEHDVLKYSKMSKIIFKSDSINNLYKNIHEPVSLKQKIIVILLMLNDKRNPSHYIDNIDITLIEPKLIEEIKDIYNKKIFTISSTQDINFFWEQLNDIMLNQNISDINEFMSDMYNILFQSLVYVNYIKTSIIVEGEEIIYVNLEYINSSNEKIKDYLEKLPVDSKNISVEYNDSISVKIIFTKEIIKKEKPKTIMDKSSINKMHYTDDEKISAIDFSKEFSIDADILDDFHDIEKDINNLLFMEDSLSQTIIDDLSLVLNKYTEILNQTYEFNDLCSTLSGLSNVFSILSVDDVQEEKKQMLMAYIKGLVDDLQSWKLHIFVNKNTPDIHYLDASFLDNCAEIEKFILSDAEDEDSDDGLEFF